MLKFRVRQIIPCLDYQDLVSRKIIPDDIFLKNKLPSNVEELRSCFSKIGAELQKRQQNYSSLLHKIAACMEGVEEMTADMEKEQCEALVDKAKFPFWVKSGGPVFGMFVELLIQNFLSLEEEMHKRVIAQNSAVSSVAQALRRLRSGFVNKKRPISVFLFLVIEWLQREKQHALEFAKLKMPRLVRWSIYSFIVFVLFIFGGKEQEFIYFQF